MSTTTKIKRRETTFFFIFSPLIMEMKILDRRQPALESIINQILDKNKRATLKKSG